MERLTFEGNFCDIAQCRENPCPYNGSCFQRETWERLKQYEGTGLAPEDCAEYRKFEDEIIASGKTFGRLVELLKADKEGRVVVLPCKRGDTVYCIRNNPCAGGAIHESFDGANDHHMGAGAVSGVHNQERLVWQNRIFDPRGSGGSVKEEGGKRMEKKILDVTCGARTIWFDKHHPAAVYCDKRREEYHNLWKSAGNCSLNIDPDVLCDFTALPFPDSSFQLVVFDPPHLTRAKETSWLVKKYGKLNATWPQMLHDGFRECMRVLKPDGVLIFKWSEYDIPAEKVWAAIGQKPLFGHHSGKQSRTFWGCFMKLEEG